MAFLSAEIDGDLHTGAGANDEVLHKETQAPRQDASRREEQKSCELLPNILARMCGKLKLRNMSMQYPFPEFASYS